MLEVLLIAWLAPQDYLAQGQSAFQTGDLVAAETAFRAHLKLHPASAEALSNLAAVHTRREQFADAIALYIKAVRANPSLKQIRFNLAIAELKAGRPADAARNLELFLEAFPGDDRARTLLGAALVEAGDFQRAISELEKARPSPATQYALAVAHARAGDENRAAALLSSLTPSAAELTRGFIDYRRGRFPEAKERFEAALKLDPNHAPAVAALGRLALLENRDADAIALLERALKLAPQDAESTYQLGVLYDRNARTADGRSMLARALTLRADYPDPHYQLARIDYREKRYAAALKHLHAAAKVLPDHEAVRLLMAQTYRALGRTAEADKEFAEVRRLKKSRIDKSQIDLNP